MTQSDVSDAFNLTVQNTITEISDTATEITVMLIQEHLFATSSSIVGILLFVFRKPLWRRLSFVFN